MPRTRIAVFIVLLWLPLLGWLGSVPEPIVMKENRPLAPFPHLKSAADASTFFRNFNYYYRDHFGFRSRLIFGQNLLRVIVLRGTPTRPVTIGKDGWMFQGTIDDNAHQTLHTKQELETMSEKIEMRHTFYARQGIDYRALILPTSDGIYSEFWPDESKTKPITNTYDQFYDFWKARHGEGVFIDVKDMLLRNKYIPFNAGEGTTSNNIIYFRYDSHWNSLGTYLALQTVMSELNKTHPCLTPPPLNAFTISAEDAPETTADQLALGTIVHERVYILRVRSDQPAHNCKEYLLIIGDSMVEHTLAEWLKELGYQATFISKDTLWSDIETKIKKYAPTIILDERNEHRFQSLFEEGDISKI